MTNTTVARPPGVSSGGSVTIGQDSEKGVAVTVQDTEREGGFYILGQSRTGKSTLLVSMALQDIANGHGLLFIDPHYDAINQLLARIPSHWLKDVILLDPSDYARSFALNVPHCPDPENEIELDMAAGRARDIFTKLWADERGELGIWLNKIMTNAVHILLANPREGYTLADIPLLLTDDATLRNALLRHVKKTRRHQYALRRSRGRDQHQSGRFQRWRNQCHPHTTDPNEARLLRLGVV